MKITSFAIEQIAKKLKDIQNGKSWVALFNSYGARDVYDKLGLPDIGKPNGQRPSKSEYIAERLSNINGTLEMSRALIHIANIGDLLPNMINEIIRPENYTIELVNDKYVLVGEINVVDKNKLETEAHFQDIQNQILKELEATKVSVLVAMAWFTNDVLAQKLIQLHDNDIDVKVALYDDGINKRHGVNLAGIPLYKIKAQRGGIMHNKFCVIDNQVVITGSYNWSSNAEFKNDENISIIKDNNIASDYSVQFKRLLKEHLQK